MGRKKEELVNVVFRLPVAERTELERMVIASGFSITRNTKDGTVVLPDWRSWGEAIAKKKILMYQVVDTDT